MKRSVFLWALLAALLMLTCAQAQAEVVGRVTEVEGRVDILKGGNLPATPVKVNDTVAPKDVIRTKSLSKAQITFIDNSVLTISPESRIAIEEYMLDTAAGKRRAVLEVFQGLALAVVNKIFKAEEPDFVIKTQTAIMGVRGTEIGIRIHPNSSTVMNFKGLTQVGNIFPEVGQMFLKAFKVAYTFGPPGAPNTVLLKDMQATTVARNLPPTLPYQLTTQDRQMFMHQLTTITPQMSQRGDSSQAQGPLTPSGPTGSSITTPGGTPSEPGTTTPTSTSVSSTTPVSPVTSNAPGPQTTLAVLNTVTVPPVVTPQPTPTPPTQTFTFLQNYSGTYTKPSESPFTTATYMNTTPGSGTRTGVYPSAFTANFSIVATASTGLFSPSSTGTISATSTANVSGPVGGVLTGTMQMNATTNAGTTFTLSGPVTLNPNGNLTYQTTGTFSSGNISGTTNGTWTQTNSSPTL
ncbi:MAG: FecR family protein [Thermodesulfobacteriota bacterium]